MENEITEQGKEPCDIGPPPAPLKEGCTFPLRIKALAKWSQEAGRGQLLLTPIQRSAVWRNSQIINYWDSLLRGYPPGLMYVHSRKEKGVKGRTLDGRTVDVRETDSELLDGQQRLTAILLGLGKGQLKDHLKIWVDLGTETPADWGLRFALRITSTGQPFGYQPSAPNEKPPLHKRHDKAEQWVKQLGSGTFDSRKVFANARGNDLIDATCAVSLSEITRWVLEHGSAHAAATLRALYPSILPGLGEVFAESVAEALNMPVLFQVMGPNVLGQEDNYIRFFGRLGQGGTALTNDELTYSIIKYHFPQVHERMREISDGAAGRVAGEVNLVLAALRVAKVLAPWNNSGDWQIFGRPYPGFVSRLKDLPDVLEKFIEMVPEKPGEPPQPRELKQLMESIRKRLEYEPKINPGGLPAILLARLPHELVDVLLLMEVESQREGTDPFPSLPSFALYWLLFVVNSEKAANHIFRLFCKREGGWQPGGDGQLIRLFEKEGVSRRLPALESLEDARGEIRDGTYLLRDGTDRFAVLDSNKDHPTGDAVRVLSANGELIRRALLWLQREYLAERFPRYDPTSSRDEDLPVDLDHLIPHERFAWDWRTRQKRLSLPDDGVINFGQLRGLIGNSLGNCRWLGISENRSRQAKPLEKDDAGRDVFEDVNDWNALIGEGRAKKKWDKDDVAAFQRLIDLRTITIYERLLTQGGLKDFVTAPPPAS